MIGNVTATAMHLPGHTPDHLGYKVGGRTPSNFCISLELIAKTHQIMSSAATPSSTLTSAPPAVTSPAAAPPPSSPQARNSSPCPPAPKSGQDMTTRLLPSALDDRLAAHLKDEMTEQEFIALREKRDRILAAPKLLHQSLQMNIRAGRLPRETGKGSRRLHLPLKLECEPW